MMRFWKNQDGTSPLLGIMVALVVFTATFSYVVFVAVEDGQNTTSNPQAALDGKAASLASLMIQPGVGWYPDSACITTPSPPELDEEQMHADQVADGRFGLGRESCEDPTTKQGDQNLLDYAKVINLRSALLEADSTNDHVDYEEARTSLGLDETSLDFHLRSEPVMADIRELLARGYKDPNLRPLYIGDYFEDDGAGGEEEPLVLHTAGVEEAADGKSVDLYVDIDNDMGSPTIFEVQFSIPLSAGTINALYHTPIVAGGTSHKATVTVLKTDDWSWADMTDPTVEYLISDVDRVVGEGAISLSGIDMADTTETKTLYITHTSKLQWKLTGSSVGVKVYYEAFEGDGSEASSPSWRLDVYDSADALVASDEALNSRGHESFDLATGDPEETFRAELTNGDGTAVWNIDNLNVVTTEVGPYGGAGNWVPAASATLETLYVEQIIEQFERNVFSSAYDHADIPHDSAAPAPPDPAAGDVYPDVKNVMNNDVPAVLLDDADQATLDNYNVVMVGSNVDHQAMTSAAAKQTIREWVYAGGLLIVFGSTEQAVQWLQPIFHSAIETAGGGIATPDENHPVLNVPNDLDYESYEDHDIVWSYTRDQDADHFTHIITEGDDDYLALSDPGQFGEGRVLLASYQPYDLTTDQGSECTGTGEDLIGCEPLRMIHNFVTIHYQGLYLDYGPKLPVDRAHGSAIRLAAVDHPELDQRVAMKLFIYVF